MNEAERSLRTIRWKVAYQVSCTRAIEADDDMTRRACVSVGEDFLSLILVCNKGLGLPHVDEKTLSSQEYLDSIMLEGLPF